MGRTGLGMENQELCLDVLNLRFLLDLHVKMSTRQLDSQLEFKGEICAGGLPW